MQIQRVTHPDGMTEVEFKMGGRQSGVSERIKITHSRTSVSETNKEAGRTKERGLLRCCPSADKEDREKTESGGGMIG